MKNERRRHTRVAVEVDVEVSVQIYKKCCGRVTDISETGFFAESGSNVAKGSFVVIKLSGQKIMIGATVHRVAENGFGAEFGSMNDARREVISSYLPKPDHAKVSLVSQMSTVMLLCDDESRPIHEHELEKAGFAVLKVRSIDKVIPSMERFHVVGVVSDYIVGGNDTLSILKQIKEEQERNIPVVMYSGRYDVPHKIFEELGIQCFSKSFTSPRNLVGYIKKSISEDHK
ncbi:MAG: PilZ domain-containing protein [Dissulfurispiraceae bacterium]